MPVETVFRVRHTALIDGNYHQAVTDLIFRDGVPVGVLHWAGPPGNEYPLVTLELDPAHLTKFSDGIVNYLYDALIEFQPPEQ